MIERVSRTTTATTARWSVFSLASSSQEVLIREAASGVQQQQQQQGVVLMQMVSAQEKAALEAKREELYKAQLDVQDRIRKAASLGDLSENAEYHFAKEENRNIQRQLAELEAKLRNVSVVATDDVPEDMVFLGHTVKLLDLDDDSEQLVRLVGEATPPDANSEILPVSVNSPMGEALMKARVGETVKVKAPRGTMEFRILEIVQE
jgi:transcription elongation factor GreA